MSHNLDKLIEEYSKKLMDSIPPEQIIKSSINTRTAESEKKEQQESESAYEKSHSADELTENKTEEQEKEYLRQIINIINNSVNNTDKSVKEHVDTLQEYKEYL